MNAAELVAFLTWLEDISDPQKPIKWGNKEGLASAYVEHIVRNELWAEERRIKTGPSDDDAPVIIEYATKSGSLIRADVYSNDAHTDYPVAHVSVTAGPVCVRLNGVDIWHGETTWEAAVK